MAKQHLVFWSHTAISQRNAILKYWIEKNGSADYAKKLVKLIRKRILVISKNPHAFKQTDFKSHRVSALGHFSIVYKVIGKKVVITAFWDNRQDPNRLLEILKND